VSAPGVRPLTDEMVGYARGDTHHLLYVYDRLKQQLAAGSAAVLERDNVTKAGSNTRSSQFSKVPSTGGRRFLSNRRSTVESPFRTIVCQS